MSLSSNVLFSLGQMPQLYLRSPSPYPTDLPGHARLGPDRKPLALPLSRLSLEQMWHFLEIEYPAEADAPPEGSNWKTIGQIYSFARCIILSKHLRDEDFRAGDRLRQIQPTNYSPNSIDTVFPHKSFDNTCPVAAPVPGSAAHVAGFMSREDSHAGRNQLLVVNSRQTALEAIQTIDAQGEGYGPSKFDDQSDRELSHYEKFLELQSQLVGYDPRTSGCRGDRSRRRRRRSSSAPKRWRASCSTCPTTRRRPTIPRDVAKSPTWSARCTSTC
jgi:hypothetical protein